MKFHQLKTGQWFELQGKRYLKVSPLMARLPDSSRDQIVPRSKEIKPLDMERRPTAEKAAAAVPLAVVITAIGRWRRRCTEELAGLQEPLDEKTRQAIEHVLDRAQQRLQSELAAEAECDE